MTRQLTATALSIAIVLGASTAALAAPELPALLGKTIRVTLVDGRRVEGKVKQQTSDSIVVDAVRCATADVRAVEEGDGLTDGAVRGFIAGAVVGILGGALASDAAAWDRTNHDTPEQGVARGLISGLIGAVIGAVIDHSHKDYTTLVIIGAKTSVAPVVTLRSLGLTGTVRW